MSNNSSFAAEAGTTVSPAGEGYNPSNMHASPYQASPEVYQYAGMRRYHPTSGSAVLPAGDRRHRGSYHAASDDAIHEANALLRSGRLDSHPSQGRVWDFQQRQYPGQRLQPKGAYPIGAYQMERGLAPDSMPHPRFHPSCATPLVPEWHGRPESTQSQPTDFSLLDTPEIHGLSSAGRPDAGGRAVADQLEQPCRRRSQEVTDYMRSSGRPTDARWQDPPSGATANPLLQMWWGQFAPGGVSDEWANAGFSQSEWHAAGRWRSSHSARDDGPAAGLQRPAPINYYSSQGIAALYRHYGGAPSACSDLEEAMYGRNVASQPPEQDKMSEEELSSSTQVPTGSPAAQSNRPKTSKPKRTSQLKPSKKASASATVDAFFTCYVCHQRTDASHMKNYMRTRKICDTCRNAEFCIKNDRKVRYCQLCSWIHSVDEFDVGRRSCRAELKRHNERRRNAKKLAANAKKVTSSAQAC